MTPRGPPSLVVMIPPFALDLGHDGIRLLQRKGTEWRELGVVALDDPELGGRLAGLADMARVLSDGDVQTELIIPPSQILYTTLESPSSRKRLHDNDIRSALEGKTPVDPEELVFDWRRTGNVIKVAVLERRTLKEAEEFADANGFNPVSFTARPEPDQFPETPDFGPTTMAAAATAILEADLPPAGAGLGEVDILDDPAPDPEVEAPLAFNSSRAGYSEKALGANVTEAAIPAEDDPGQDAPATPEADVAVEIEPDVSAEDIAESGLDLVSADDAEVADLDAETTEPDVPDGVAEIVVDEGAEDEVADTSDADEIAEAPEDAALEDMSSGEDDDVPAEPDAEDVSRSEGAPVEDADRSFEEDVPDAEDDIEAENADTEAADAEDQGTVPVADADADAAAIGMAEVETEAEDAAPEEVLDEASPNDAPEEVSDTEPEPAKPEMAEDDDSAAVIPPAPPIADSSAPETEGAAPRISMLGPETADSGPAETEAPVPPPPVRATRTEAHAIAPQARRNRQSIVVIASMVLAVIVFLGGFAILNRDRSPDPIVADTPVATTPGADPAEDAAAPEVAGVAPTQPEAPATTDAPTEDTARLEPAPDLPAAPGTALPDEDVAESEPAVDEDSEDADVVAETPTEVELEQDALRRYAASGIWTIAPEQGLRTRLDQLEGLYLASIDPKVSSQDAFSLEPPQVAEDILSVPPLPPEPGQRFELDDDGLVTATPEGALTPDGVVVTLGRPTLVPPRRPREVAPPETDAAVDEALAAAQPLRPRPRPEGLVERNERAQLGGRTRAELSAIRPNPRPISDQIAAAQAIGEAPTEQAVAVSRNPRSRPDGFAAIVAAVRAANRPAPTQTAAATPSTASSQPVAAQPQQPQIPTVASVARQATVENAINLRRVNLIGVYGSTGDRRALVRLPSGRYVKVQVGDRVDGGQVAAISDTQLRYVKGGRNVVLDLPGG